MNSHPDIQSAAQTAVEIARRSFVTEYMSVGNTTTPLARPLPKRLLGIWAHPDDEAYLSAGLMARVVAAGGSVTVLTATRGEKGQVPCQVQLVRAAPVLLEGEASAVGIHTSDPVCQ